MPPARHRSQIPLNMYASGLVSLGQEAKGPWGSCRSQHSLLGDAKALRWGGDGHVAGTAEKPVGLEPSELEGEGEGV